MQVSAAVNHPKAPQAQALRGFFHGGCSMTATGGSRRLGKRCASYGSGPMKFEWPMLVSITQVLLFVGAHPVGDGLQGVCHADRPQGWAPTKKAHRAAASIFSTQ